MLTDRPVGPTSKKVPRCVPEVREMRGDPRAVDHQVLQLPAVVGKRLNDRTQAVGVRVEPVRRAVDDHLWVDELGKVCEPVLVATHVVAAVEHDVVRAGHGKEDAALGSRRHLSFLNGLFAVDGVALGAGVGGGSLAG